MPFKSASQMRAAFSGALGQEMKGKAHEWAHETPNLKKLPDHVKHAKAHMTRAAVVAQLKSDKD